METEGKDEFGWYRRIIPDLPEPYQSKTTEGLADAVDGLKSQSFERERQEVRVKNAEQYVKDHSSKEFIPPRDPAAVIKTVRNSNSRIRWNQSKIDRMKEAFNKTDYAKQSGPRSYSDQITEEIISRFSAATLAIVFIGLFVWGMYGVFGMPHYRVVGYADEVKYYQLRSDLKEFSTNQWEYNYTTGRFVIGMYEKPPASETYSVNENPAIWTVVIASVFGGLTLIMGLPCLIYIVSVLWLLETNLGFDPKLGTLFDSLADVFKISTQSTR